MTQHIRYEIVQSANPPSAMAVQRVPSDQEAKCVSCDRTLEGDPLVIMRTNATTHEVALTTVCSVACEARLRAAMQTFIEHEPKGVLAQQAVRSKFDTQSPRTWQALSTPEMLKALGNDTTSPRLPSNAVLHKCTNPTCYCRFERYLTHPHGRPDANHAWLIEVYERLRRCHVYEDVLLSDVDVRCGACSRVTSGRCPACLCAHFCSPECRAAGAAKHAPACLTHDVAWSPYRLC